MTNEEIWQVALSEIELSISRANFITWFKGTKIISNVDGKIVISVPNGFTKEWLENKYNAYILKALRNLQSDIKTVSCLIETPKEKPLAHREQAMDAIVAPSKIGYKKSSASSDDVDMENNLNPKYTFENFVIGGNNELAHAACFSVSQNLGRIYNPLFIYGGVGLGKTHLIQSIGNEILKQNPSFKVKYITSERFTNNLINALQNQTIKAFKEYYQKIDILIIDDIQFISGKEKTQEEFFHIFNYLYQLDKQIVLSSDRSPKAIQILEERLRSRFEGGMTADVSKPDLETRVAILRKKSINEGLRIDEKALDFIAANIKDNIRELEGALNRIIVASQLTEQEITLEFVANQLSELISSGKKKGITCKQILKAVSSFYDVSFDELVLKNRKQELVRPRQVAMYLLRSELDFSYPGIGEKLGGRDHTTAMHAFEKISKLLEEDAKLLDEINSLKEQLYRIY
ncbi:MAG TPA: chromosomal replication initiator protein DnaA [Candidatus Moranbacteria bacterium]|nr:chromosomal replication initiator protein DnaA [Candidatus Moranbacteria bacterium]HAT75115.1 chromosomal replication initiator protein DnaA [Candidatus Moranbacteria bacterium]